MYQARGYSKFVLSGMKEGGRETSPYVRIPLLGAILSSNKVEPLRSID